MRNHLRAACCAAVTLAVAVTMCGCGTPHPGATAVTSRPYHAAATVATTPPGSVSIFVNVQLNPADGVVFTGQPLGVTVLSQDGGGPATDWPLAQATVSFGDGSSQSITASCAGRGSPTLSADHAYAKSGRFVTRVTAARFCNPAGQADVSPGDSESGFPLVLPSAPAGSATWPRCTQGQLQIAAGLDDVGLGNRELLFTLRNVSSSDCRLYGYPGLRLAAPDGNVLPVTVERGGAYLFPAVPPSLVGLAPGDLASFDVGYFAGVSPSSSCDWATDAEVFVPGSFFYTAVSLTSVGTGADSVACGGQFRVSPVVGGAIGVGTGT